MPTTPTPTGIRPRSYILILTFAILPRSYSTGVLFSPIAIINIILLMMTTVILQRFIANNTMLRIFYLLPL